MEKTFNQFPLKGMQGEPFDKPINRRGTNSVKYDEMPDDDTIALWVADMDFETAPVVREALLERMQHGCFGYTFVPESYYDATISWFSRRHHWQIDRSWFIYTSGVVPAISAIIKGIIERPADALLHTPDHTPDTPADTPADSHSSLFTLHSSLSPDTPSGGSRGTVLVQTPVYNCFFSSIRNNGCTLAENPLVLKDGRYEIDWEDFERQCADESVKIFILCNPHNPAGRVWTREELIRMGEICKRHGVFVISDEIHCEFTNKCSYTPFASVSDAPCAVCLSPSKAFNIAGLQIANIIIPDESIRKNVDKAININEVCDVNPFGVIALQAAYSAEGEQWLNALNEYIYANYDYARAFLAEHLPQWHVVTLEGTYLMWVDISATGLTSDALADRLLREANVCVNAGTMYGEVTGRNFIRINLATQRARLAEGLRRIAEVIGER